LKTRSSKTAPKTAPRLEKTAPGLELDVSFAAWRPWTPRARQLARWAEAALTPLRRSVVLSIRVVGAARSRRLNAQYRRKNKATNVLSFAGAGIAPDGRLFLGELVICAPVVAREAHAGGVSLESHWAHLTVHGVLHLKGLDHEGDAEARKMAAKEVQILDRLGFSDPYR
jgi:probable rRNA maturation factor